MHQDATAERRNNIAPIPFEADAPFLKIVGELPRELNGTLYRNGPNPQFDSPGAHWFVGDGMLHAFHLENGRASYRNRWVRTPKWLAEHDAGRALFGGFGRKLPDAPANLTDGGVANTNIVFHAGKLLALEEAHAPYALDPATLMPVNGGYETWGDRLAGPFTAHPKLDPVTGEMVFFGYSATGRFTREISLQTVSAAGEITRAEMLDGPFPSMIHDFAVTRNWIIVPVFPLTSSMERALSGKPPFAWEPDRGTHIAFVPRNGTVADVKWVAAPPCYVFHPMNHYETDDGRIVVDVMKFDVAPLFPLPDGSPSSETTPKARLTRWTFDLSGQSNTFHEEQLDDRAGEFPRFDERFCMSDYRHGWIMGGDFIDKKTREPQNDGLVHYDLKTGKSAVWREGPGDRFGEPVFVPRAEDAAEGDGWLLSVLYRGEAKRSDLAVFEATDIEKGPIAVAHLSSRVPAGFHGNWRPGTLDG